MGTSLKRMVPSVLQALLSRGTAARAGLQSLHPHLELAVQAVQAVRQYTSCSTHTWNLQEQPFSYPHARPLESTRAE